MHVLRRALQAYVAEWNARIKDLTPPQYSVLRTLQERPGINQSCLGAVTGIDVATLTTMLHRLEKRGLVSRSIDPGGDRRRKVLAVTDSGVEVVKRVAPHLDAVDEKALRGLTPKERASLRDMLKRVALAGPVTEGTRSTGR